MLPRSLLPLALLGALGASASCTPPTLSYQVAWTSGPARAIDFVSIDEQGSRVRLGIYARGEPVGAWDSDPTAPEQTLPELAPGEAVFRSADARVLGVRGFAWDGPARGTLGSVRETRLRWLGRPSAPAWSLPAPARGARDVHVSGDGSTLILESARRQGQGPSSLVVLRRRSPESAFEQVGSFAGRSDGALQLSRGGEVIAQADGEEVRVLGADGVERLRVRAGIGFHLAPSGEVLAVRQPLGVRFVPLDPPGPGRPARVQLAAAPLGVVIAGRFALVHSRAELALVEWRTGREHWRKQDPEQAYSAVDLAPRGPDEVVLVVGRLEVLRPTVRRGGALAWGRARACVDVLDVEGAPIVATHVFETSRWTHDAPRVQLLGQAERVLAYTSDTVLVSRPLP